MIVNEIVEHFMDLASDPRVLLSEELYLKSKGYQIIKHCPSAQ